MLMVRMEHQEASESGIGTTAIALEGTAMQKTTSETKLEN